MQRDCTVLGIETSCDETGLALFRTGSGILSQAVHSQVDLHEAYGGVVPELASRDHIRRVIPLARKVLAEGSVRLDELDAIAYTAGPGLAGALLVGASVANGLAGGLGIPALAIHHLEGHLLSPLLATPAPQFPFVALLVSGGHTQLMRVGAIGKYALLGETVDDAAGEAFDKTAQLLGLGYPGGPAIAALATRGNAGQVKLPRPMIDSGDLDFSFAGLKTAVLTRVRERPDLDPQFKADVAAAFQQAVVDVLVAKCLAALDATGLDQIVVAGGVGANRSLRESLDRAVNAQGARVYYPEPALCTDNGAMIAFAAALRIQSGLAAVGEHDYGFTVMPRWSLA